MFHFTPLKGPIWHARTPCSDVFPRTCDTLERCEVHVLRQQMARTMRKKGLLIGPSGIGKAQLTHLIEAFMRSFREHDETEYKKLVEWQRQVKTRGCLQSATCRFAQN